MPMRLPAATVTMMALLAPLRARAADADDVRAAMKHMDALVTDHKWLDALDNYVAVNDSERNLARAMVEMDDAMDKFQTAVRAKFGDAGWNTIGAAVHALPKGGVDAVNVTITGDLATVTWAGATSPEFLKKVGGVWKISVPDLMAYSMKAAGATETQARELEPQVLEISVDRVRRMSSGLVWLSLEITAGKYATPADAKSAADAVMNHKKT
ncbi:MAG TPA: hypothetical protein VH253_09370 [Phycisphaerae bacterium]|nr:hypothetical protein [Phycisphaerae bacterium]